MKKQTTLSHIQKIDYFWRSAQFLLLFSLIGCQMVGIQAQNNPPIPEALTDCTDPLTPITVCHTWEDPEGHAVQIDEDETHTTFNCSLTFLNDTCFRYLPLPGFLGTDTVSITVCDDQEPPACSVSKLTIYVGCVAPLAHDDVVQIASNSVLINGNASADNNGRDGVLIPILNNDEDRCRDLSIINLLSLPANGQTSIVSNADIFYTPNTNFEGTDQFRYVTCNDCIPPQCDTATVNIAVLPQNEACNLDFAECVGPFSSINLCPQFCEVALEDMDTCLATAIRGDVGLQVGNCVVYVPDPVFVGIDTVLFVACDGAFCDTTRAFVTIDPACGDNPPVATTDVVQTRVNTAVIVEVLDNDFDVDGQTLSVTNVSEPLNGTASINSDMVIYTPNEGFVGTDTLTYVLCDPTDNCVLGLVIVEVVEQNCAEREYEYCTPSFQFPVEICVEFCDLVGLEGVRVVDATTTFNCSITLLNDSCFRYTPLPGFEGTDTVTIFGAAQNGQRDTLFAQVNLGCAFPEAQNDVATIDTDDQSSIELAILTNDKDPCGLALVPLILTEAANGVLTTNEDGTIEYTPAEGFTGTEEILYVACNDCEQVRCDTANISITVTGNGGNPELFVDAQPDVTETPFETSVNINVLQNDFGTITTITFELASNGIVILENDSSFTYTPNEGFSGTDFFTYQICNNLNQCDETVVTITVQEEPEPDPEPQAPIANNDAIATDAGEPVTIEVLENDLNPEEGALTITDTISPNNGTLTINLPENTITYTPNEDFVGEDVFQYIVCNEQNLCDTAIVSVTVGSDTPTNLPPIAVNDSITTSNNTVLDFNVLMNDSDPNEGDSLAAQLLTQPTNGTASLGEDGELMYTPNPDFSGIESFVYEVCDNGEPVLCAVGTVVIIVESNAIDTTFLMAQTDVEQTPFETPLDILVLQNDQGDGLTINSTSPPENGTVTLSADSSRIVYVPNADFSGIDYFFYEVCDQYGDCGNTIVSITVLPQDAINQSPIAHSDLAETAMNVSVNISVLANDSDPEQTPLTITATSDPTNGTVTINEDGTLSYTPDVDFVGIDTFSYTVCDAENECVTALVAISVGEEIVPNLPPLALTDIDSTTQNEALEFNVLINDSDPNADDRLTVELLSTTINGDLILEEDGAVNYTPAINFQGMDYFTYRICDDGIPSLCDTAYATILVLPGQVITLIEAAPDVRETPFETPATINVLANDLGEALILTPESVTEPVHGSIEVNADGTVVYTPDENYAGPDYFFYQVCTPDNLCDFTIVSIFVLNENATPKEPRANNDIAQTPVNTAITIPVLQNDSDPENDTLTITSSTSPANGMVTINEDGTITYMPNPEFIGVDTFTYTVCDPQELCDEAIISVAVGAETIQNHPPKALNDEGVTVLNEPLLIDVKANDHDPDGDNITGLLIAAPLNGLVILDGETGIATYTPNPDFAGTDYFVYLVCDDGLPQLCDTAFVSILIIDAIRPDAEPDIAYTLENTAISLEPLHNDRGENVTITKIGSPSNGTVVEGINGTLTYTPEDGFTGTDHFVYTICDPNNLCDQTVVSIIVAPENTPNRLPIANNDVDTTSINTPVNVPVLSNDSDPDHDVLLVQTTTTPTNGTVALLNDGESVIYQPNPDFVGVDSFEYVACDPNPFCDTAWVYISVGTGILSNNPPLAQDDAFETESETPITLSILENDSDPNQDSLMLTFMGEPSNGTITTINNEFIYTPNNGFSGTDYALYVLCDNGLPSLCDTAVIQVNVVGEEQGLVIQVATPEDTDVTICLAEELRMDLEIDTIVIYEISNNGIPYYPENNDTCVAYSPITDFVGIDTFVVGVCRMENSCDTVTIIITVEPVPDVPEAIVDIDTTTINTPINMDVLANDSDPDGDVLQIDSVETPQNGTAVILDSTILYTPNEDFVGVDTFSYYITDSVGLRAAATVIVFVMENEDTTIIPTPTPLLAMDDIDSTTLNTPIVLSILANDSLPVSNAEINIIEQPDNGAVSIVEEGGTTVNYSPNVDFTGSDTFTYEVCLTLSPDSIICDTATVTVIVANATTIADCDGIPIQVSPAISPNGDNVNDRLRVLGEDCFEDDQLIVFNRWGDEVYRVENYTNFDGWDGQYQKTNTPVPDGTYFYIYWFKNQEGEMQDVTGAVEVFR